MKRAALASVLASVLAGGCLLPASAIAGGNGAQQFVFPVSATGLVNPCNGDTMSYTGTQHVGLNTTPDGQGGFNVVEHSNLHMTATTDQGDIYVMNASSNDPGHYMPGGAATMVSTLETVSQGSAPNFKIDMLLHLTLNANGTLTATVSDGDATCTP